MAWILSWMISSLVLPCSFYFTYNLHNMDWTYASNNLVLNNMDWTSNNFAYVIASLFLSFMVMDLLMGFLYYPERINFMSGYFHHLLYSYILLDFTACNIPGILGLLCMLEFPTFVLSIGNLNPRWRNDRLFGFLFFTTRIVYHSFLLFKIYPWFTGNDMPPQSSRFLVYMAMGLPMHLYWFSRWITSSAVGLRIKVD